MIWNYIGEETVMNLLGTNPYELNKRHYCITYKVNTYEEVHNIVRFFRDHIPSNKIVEIVRHLMVCEDGIERPVCKRIIVQNVFGETSEVEIMYER